MARSLRIRSTVASPIVVDGRRWGAMITASSRGDPLPAGTDSRLGELTELVATAIAKPEARGEVHRLAEEQAALRRVATLVAEGAAPTNVCVKVARRPTGAAPNSHQERSGTIADIAHRLQVNMTVGAPIAVANRTVRVEVRDAGIGGAEPEGRGLQGMADRVAALRGCRHTTLHAPGGTASPRSCRCRPRNPRFDQSRETLASISSRTLR
jgi:hypothetical protein